MNDGDLRSIQADAEGVAAASAGAAAVRVRQLSALDDLDAACRLCGEIWRPDPDKPLITTELLRAFGKAGNYVAGAFDSGADVAGAGRLVGTCVGFFEAPADRAVHSHVAGVAPEARGRGVGWALKLDQRAWALRHGVATICWTFDPLVSRNAFFNIGKLAALPVEYLPDFYGSMRNQINEADQSDRLLVRWDLAAAAVQAACEDRAGPGGAGIDRDRGAAVALTVAADGRPSAASTGSVSASTLLVEVPADIETLRTSDPRAAREWRVAVRDVLGGLMTDGGRVIGFERGGRDGGQGGGRYVVEVAR